MGSTSGCPPDATLVNREGSSRRQPFRSALERLAEPIQDDVDLVLLNDQRRGERKRVPECPQDQTAV